MRIDLEKPLYAKDNDDSSIHPVCSIEIPMGNKSGKDFIVLVGECYEWRSINDSKFIPQGYIPDV